MILLFRAGLTCKCGDCSKLNWYLLQWCPLEVNRSFSPLTPTIPRIIALQTSCSFAFLRHFGIKLIVRTSTNIFIASAVCTQTCDIAYGHVVNPPTPHPQPLPPTTKKSSMPSLYPILSLRCFSDVNTHEEMFIW